MESLSNVRSNSSSSQSRPVLSNPLYTLDTRHSLRSTTTMFRENMVFLVLLGLDLSSRISTTTSLPLCIAAERNPPSNTRMSLNCTARSPQMVLNFELPRRDNASTRGRTPRHADGSIVLLTGHINKSPTLEIPARVAVLTPLIDAFVTLMVPSTESDTMC